jgi:hypothetical protein
MKTSPKTLSRYLMPERRHGTYYHRQVLIFGDSLFDIGLANASCSQRLSRYRLNIISVTSPNCANLQDSHNVFSEYLRENADSPRPSLSR